MKKLILVIGIIVIVHCNLTAQDGFNLYGYGSLDYYPTYIDNMIDMSVNDDFFSTIIGVGIEYKYDILIIFIEAAAYTEMNKIPEILSFDPTYSEYYFEVSAWYGPIGILFSHQYNHLIDTSDISRRGEFTTVGIEFDTRKIR